jgi:hypothetical protein
MQISLQNASNSHRIDEFRMRRRLARREYYAEKSLTLARAARRSSLAEERVALKQLEETELFREAMRSEAGGGHNIEYQAHQALAIARAVHATLVAEKQLAAERIDEAKLKLQASYDEAEAVDGRIRVAEEQLGDILDATASKGLTFAPSMHTTDIYNFLPRRRHQIPCSCECSDDTSSGSDASDLESYYDLRSEFEGEASGSGMVTSSSSN